MILGGGGFLDSFASVVGAGEGTPRAGVSMIDFVKRQRTFGGSERMNDVVLGGSRRRKLEQI